MIGPSVEQWRNRWQGYAFAVGVVLLAGLLRSLLDPALGTRLPFIFFFPALLAAAAVGGAGPAIVALLLSAVLAAIFTRDALSAWTLEQTAFYIAAGSGVIVIALLLDRLRTRASQLAQELGLLIDGASNHAIYMCDPAGRITLWNDGAERLKGWREDEIVGRHMSIFYPAQEVANGQPAADLASALEDGQLEAESWRMRKDGSAFLANVTITPLWDGGRHVGFGKVVRDVTEQRRIEREAQAAAAHVRSILSTIPDGMIVIDAVGRILSINGVAGAMFGYEEADLLGADVSILVSPSDRERHASYLRDFVDGNSARIIGHARDVEGQRRDGTCFPLEVTIGEAFDGGRRIFIGFLRDLSQHRRAQVQIEELRSNLIHVARVSSMGTMASTLAHELNQPLTAVANYVEGIRALLDQADDESRVMVEEALEETQREVLRAGTIVRRLRQFVARGEVEKTVEDLPALIEEASKLALIGARERGITVSFDLDHAASPVLVDKVQIQQVLINLMRNGIEAMDTMKVRRLSVASRIEGPDAARITVEDTGPGIADDMAEQLFRAFTTTKSSGMGLGLSICRTIVEANGGRIWTAPRAGGGTQFHFTVMLARPHDALPAR